MPRAQAQELDARVPRRPDDSDLDRHGWPRMAQVYSRIRMIMQPGTAGGPHAPADSGPPVPTLDRPPHDRYVRNRRHLAPPDSPITGSSSNGPHCSSMEHARGLPRIPVRPPASTGPPDLADALLPRLPEFLAAYHD